MTRILDGPIGFAVYILPEIIYTADVINLICLQLGA
jgi:hypothetical protein